MAEQKIGPYLVETVGTQLLQGIRIEEIIWVGTTVAGDVAQIKDPIENIILWECKTDTTNTYLGAGVPTSGIHAPNGFVVTILDGGKLLIYPREG